MQQYYSSPLTQAFDLAELRANYRVLARIGIYGGTAAAATFLPGGWLLWLTVAGLAAGDVATKPINKRLDTEYPDALPPAAARKAIAAGMKEVIEAEAEETTDVPDLWARTTTSKKQPVNPPKLKAEDEPTEVQELIQTPPLRRRTVDWSKGTIERFKDKVPAQGFSVDAVDDDYEEFDRLCREYCGRFGRINWKKSGKLPSGIPYLVWFVFGLNDDANDYDIAAELAEGYLIELSTKRQRPQYASLEASRQYFENLEADW